MYRTLFIHADPSIDFRTAVKPEVEASLLVGFTRVLAKFRPSPGIHRMQAILQSEVGARC